MSKNSLIQHIEKILFEEQLKKEMKISHTASRIYCVFMSYEESKNKNHEKTDCICINNNAAQ